MSSTMNRESTATNRNAAESTIRVEGERPAIVKDRVTPVAAEDQSIGSLLKQLGRELPQLFTKEVALLKAEAKESIRTTKEGVAAVSVGGAVMMAGLIILLLAVVYALSNVIAPWASALIVGVVAMVIGFMMVKAGQKKFEHDLKPQHTINSLHKDKDAISGRMS